MVQEFDLTTFLQTPGEVAFVALAVVSDLERHLELREQLFAKFTNSPYVKADMIAMFEEGKFKTHLNKLSQSRSCPQRYSYSLMVRTSNHSPANEGLSDKLISRLFQRQT